MLEELLDRQAGVVTWAQALAHGDTERTIARRVDLGLWRRLHPRVYATFSGPLPRPARIWAAVLYAGPGAALSHETAAELHGLTDRQSALIHVTIPSTRRIVAAPGIVVHHATHLARAVHPTREPPCTRLEETVIDLTQTAASLEEAIGWVIRACGQRLTMPERVRAAMAARKRLRWRSDLAEVLADVADGCHSVLEQRYLRDVERAHGLPTGRRQAVRRAGLGRRYDDVRYDAFGLAVELDGRAAHPDHARSRDMRRDNRAVVSGDKVLRFGWQDVAPRPCSVAAEVVGVLRLAGWRRAATPCGRRDCVLAGSPQ